MFDAYYDPRVTMGEHLALKEDNLIQTKSLIVCVIKIIFIILH